MMRKRAVACLAIHAALLAAVASLPLPVSAGSEDLRLGGSVAVELDLIATGLGRSFSDALSSISSSDIVVADLVVSSNSVNGFQISITSQNGGKLVRLGGSPTRESDFTSYRLDVEPRVGGQLGPELPPENRRRKLDLSLGSETIVFDRNVERTTNSKAFVLEIHTSPKSELFSGTYSDTITIVLEDL